MIALLQQLYPAFFALLLAFGGITPQSLGVVSLASSLEGKTAQEKAQIKGQAIAQFGLIKKVQVENYWIEITEFKAIPQGVELYARAWDSNGQIGFGKDGSVDLEKFVFVNPPILVSDLNGTIVREWTDKETGALRQRKLREDPKEALLQSLAHTISVKQQKFDSSRIIAGKKGDTTTTCYPDADPESTSVDGGLINSIAETTWAALRGATAGSSATPSDATSYVFRISSGPTTNKWDLLDRVAILFDCSAIADTDTINSATISLYDDNLRADNLSITPNTNIFSSNPASNTNLVADDYDTVGTTAFATAITWAGWTLNNYNNFALNASGLANISKTGVSKFSAYNQNYDADNVTPTWGNDITSYQSIKLADTAGTASDPKLVVESSAAAAPAVDFGGIIIFE